MLIVIFYVYCIISRFKKKYNSFAYLKIFILISVLIFKVFVFFLNQVCLLPIYIFKNDTRMLLFYIIPNTTEFRT